MAVLGAAVLIVPAAGLAKKGEDHPGQGAGGPPAWAGGPPPWAGQGKEKTEAEAPAADAPTKTPGPTNDTLTAEGEPSTGEGSVPSEGSEPEADPEACEAPAAPVKPKGHGRSKPVNFQVRGVVLERLEGDSACVLRVEITGGNSRGRLFKGAQILVRPAVVVVDDAIAELGQVLVGDAVTFGMWLARGTAVGSVDGTERVVRKLVDTTEHPGPTPDAPVEEPAPAPPAEETPTP